MTVSHGRALINSSAGRQEHIVDNFRSHHPTLHHPTLQGPKLTCGLFESINEALPEGGGRRVRGLEGVEPSGLIQVCAVLGE